MKKLRQYMDALYLPEPEEYGKLPAGTYNKKMVEVKGLYKDGMFTERFVLLQGGYRFLLSRFLLNRTELARIDSEIKKHRAGFSAVESTEQDFYQKSDFMGLQYLYLRNPIHIERLEEFQLKFLESLLDSFYKEKAREAVELLKSTYKEVLVFSEETMFQETAIVPSLYKEWNISADTLVFVISAKATTEGKKVLLGLKNHLEPMLSIALDMPVRILIKSNERG